MPVPSVSTLGLLLAHDGHHLVVAGPAQPVLGAEVVHYQARSHTRVDSDGTQADPEAIAGEAGDGGVTDASHGGRLATLSLPLHAL